METYLTIASKNHHNLKVSEAGLFVDIHKPYLGATPDGIAECDCCERRVIEVKCPFCFKDDVPDSTKAGFCMRKGDDDVRNLNHDRMYYYQVQLQMHVCKVQKCDFVVWTKSTIIIETIEKNVVFIEQKVLDAKNFFIYGVLPEIVGKWYTRKPVADDSGTVQTTSKIQDEDECEDEDDTMNQVCGVTVKNVVDKWSCATTKML